MHPSDSRGLAACLQTEYYEEIHSSTSAAIGDLNAQKTCIEERLNFSFTKPVDSAEHIAYCKTVEMVAYREVLFYNISI